MKQSPTSRTLKWLREQGHHAAVVERWNPYAKIRQDVWGFADILSFHPLGEVVLVQCTSGSNHAARMAKIRENPIAAEWMRNHPIWVVSWAKQGARGKRKTWTVRREVVTNGK